jgi:hypothetical protein
MMRKRAECKKARKVAATKARLREGARTDDDLDGMGWYDETR